MKKISLILIVALCSMAFVPATVNTSTFKSMKLADAACDYVIDNSSTSDVDISWSSLPVVSNYVAGSFSSNSGGTGNTDYDDVAGITIQVDVTNYVATGTRSIVIYDDISTTPIIIPITGGGTYIRTFPTTTLGYFTIEII